MRTDIEHNMSIAKLEISDSIQNGTKINRGRVMEIIELMRNNESKSRHTISSEKNDTTIGKNSTEKSLEPITEIKNNIDENVQEISKAIQKGNRISKEKKTEILERMEGHKPESSQINKQQAEDKIFVSCPIACEMKLELKEYVDHIMECEKQIETCKNCGPGYRNSDIHRELQSNTTIHLYGMHASPCNKNTDSRKSQKQLPRIKNRRKYSKSTKENP